MVNINGKNSRGRVKATGSAAAVMLDTQTQIGIDQVVGQFNFEMQKQYKQGEADAMRRKGKMAVQAGWTNAFTTMLQGGYQASTRLGQPKLGPTSSGGNWNQASLDKYFSTI